MLSMVFCACCNDELQCRQYMTAGRVSRVELCARNPDVGSGVKQYDPTCDGLSAEGAFGVGSRALCAGLVAAGEHDPLGVVHAEGAGGGLLCSALLLSQHRLPLPQVRGHPGHQSFPHALPGCADDAFQPADTEQTSQGLPTSIHLIPCAQPLAHMARGCRQESLRHNMLHCTELHISQLVEQGG